MRLMVLGNAQRAGVPEEAERLLPFLRQHAERGRLGVQHVEDRRLDFQGRAGDDVALLLPTLIVGLPEMCQGNCPTRPSRPRASSTRSPIRACSANRVAWTGNGNVIVTSMLWDSALRKVRDVVTTAKPPSIRTSNRVATSGTGRGVPATKPPAMKAWSGSILVCGAIKLMGAFPHQIRQQGCYALDQRADIGAAAEHIRVDNERDAGGDRKRRALTSLEQQLDRERQPRQVGERTEIAGLDVRETLAVQRQALLDTSDEGAKPLELERRELLARHGLELWLEDHGRSIPQRMR